MSPSNALHSLYGEGHQLASTRTRECVAMPGVREQTVLTPRKVLDIVDEFYGGKDWYDPCPAHGTRGFLAPWEDGYANPPYGKCLINPVEDQAEYDRITALREVEKSAHKARTGKKSGAKLTRYPSGMIGGLEHWLAMQSLYHFQAEIIMLVPNRTNRRWLRQWRRSCDALVELDPLAFEGQKQAAPFPLVMGYTQGKRDRSGEFKDLFGVLGDPV